MTAEACPLGRGGAAHAGLHAGLRYAGYLRLDQVLGAQAPLSADTAQPIHDEHFFIVLHQAHELWFRQWLVEAAAVLQADAQAPGFFADALPKLHRMAEIQALLNQQLGLLATLDPLQFLAMRPLLGSASGSQSLQFVLLEATLGTLDEARAPQACTMMTPAENAQVLATCRQPTLHDQLARGLAAEWQRQQATPAAKACHAQWAQALTEREAAQGWPALALPAAFARLPRAAALAALLARSRSQPRERLIDDALDRLCQLEQQLHRWRLLHAEQVRELLDELPGTGGSSGHRYLSANAAAQPHSALRTLRQWAARPGIQVPA